jgi:ABC-type multidrug transport system ATPase subunit
VHLAVRDGEFVALLGANGAGKSTLLKILATLMPPSAGQLHLFGQSVASDTAAARGRIGLIGHQAMLYRDLSAMENLVFFGKLYGVRDAAGRARQLLADVGLADRAGDPVKAFSRGMTQRVAIARALMHNPELLLADEPFAGLDAPSTAALERLLAQLHRDGRTIVLVNHDITQSLKLAGRAVVLRQGQVIEDRPSDQLDPAFVLEQVGGPQ